MNETRFTLASRLAGSTAAAGYRQSTAGFPPAPSCDGDGFHRNAGRAFSLSFRLLAPRAPPTLPPNMKTARRCVLFVGLLLAAVTVPQAQQATPQTPPEESVADHKLIRVQVEFIDVAHQQLTELMFGDHTSTNDTEMPMFYTLAPTPPSSPCPANRCSSPPFPPRDRTATPTSLARADPALVRPLVRRMAV